jgi:hypothetical protein
MNRKAFAEFFLGIAQSILASRPTPIIAGLWALAGAALFNQFLYEQLSSFKWSRPYLKRLDFKVVVTIVAIILSFAPVAFFLNRPSILISTANRAPYLIEAQNGTNWLKFGVTNTQYSGTSICRAYLNDLTRGKNNMPISRGEHRMLSADDGGDPEIQNGFALSGGVERFFNLAFASAGQSNINIASKAFSDLISVPLSPDTYRAKVEVSGKDCELTSKEIVFEYKGGLEIRVVE